MKIAVRLALLAAMPWLMLALVIGVAGVLAPPATASMPDWLSAVVMPTSAILVWTGTLLTPVCTLLLLLLALRALISRLAPKGLSTP